MIAHPLDEVSECRPSRSERPTRHLRALLRRPVNLGLRPQDLAAKPADFSPEIPSR